MNNIADVTKETMQQGELANQIHTLKQKITVSRKRLNELWNAHGTTNSVVLAASIELDQLIVQYQKLQEDAVEFQERQGDGRTDPIQQKVQSNNR